MHFQCHANSEYKLHVRVDCKDVEFIGNTRKHSLTHSFIYSALCITTDDFKEGFRGVVMLVIVCTVKYLLELELDNRQFYII